MARSGLEERSCRTARSAPTAWAGLHSPFLGVTLLAVALRVVASVVVARRRPPAVVVVVVVVVVVRAPRRFGRSRRATASCSRLPLSSHLGDERRAELPPSHIGTGRSSRAYHRRRVGARRRRAALRRRCRLPRAAALRPHAGTVCSQWCHTTCERTAAWLDALAGSPGHPAPRATTSRLNARVRATRWRSTRRAVDGSNSRSGSARITTGADVADPRLASQSGTPRHGSRAALGRRVMRADRPWRGGLAANTSIGALRGLATFIQLLVRHDLVAERWASRSSTILAGPSALSRSTPRAASCRCRS